MPYAIAISLAGYFIELHPDFEMPPDFELPPDLSGGQNEFPSICKYILFIGLRPKPLPLALQAILIFKCHNIV
ncbi:hypothetical protein [Marinifilum sp. D737]|uniref:hypothetical protein n=1 Tax=Marinifilum sp. D737 TaxID=2969628 RepID=UPI002274B793|nr:hypothetical protein [Marinifilum sp. D737]MCY1636300.1 hypothetical protein [Marinifilum sp. D737]